LKQKDNNINIDRIYWLAKGLMVLILLFFTENIFAQKIFEKSINSAANKIVVNFNMIDQVELITLEEDHKIVLIAESEDNFAPNIFLEEKEGVVFIKSDENYFVENELNIDKQCAIQPIYTTYRIKIPKNKKVDISFTKGNFYADKFKGNLNLNVEEGIIKIKQLQGVAVVTINTGNVLINEITDTQINVHSNLGLVTSDLRLRNQEQSKNHLNGVFGENINQLSIQAILANIRLKSSKN